VRSQATAAAARHAQDLVCCRVAGRSYAFDSREVRFIARSDQVAAARDGVARVGTLRGPDPIPVYSMAALLHPSADADGGTHVVVTGTGEGLVGWQVDRILRGNRDEAPELLALPGLAGPVSRRWFTALIGSEEEPGLVCSPSGLDPRARALQTLAEPPLPGAVLSSSGAARGVVAVFSSSALPGCGAARYAISGRRIVAVVQSMAACVVPGTPSHVVALAAWRGLAVPLLDLSGGTSAAHEGNRGRYLLVRYGTGAHATVVGIAIDRDVVLHRASAADAPIGRPVADVPPGIQLFSIGGEPAAFFDLDALIGQRVDGALGGSQES